jgi:hypothetical protein
LSGTGHELAGRDQRLLVCERDGLAGIDGCHDWFQSRTTDNRRDDEFGVAPRCLDQRGLASRSPAVGTAQERSKVIEPGLVGNDGLWCAGTPCDIGKGFDIGCGRDRYNFELVAIAFDQDVPIEPVAPRIAIFRVTPAPVAARRR